MDSHAYVYYNTSDLLAGGVSTVRKSVAVFLALLALTGSVFFIWSCSDDSTGTGPRRSSRFSDISFKVSVNDPQGHPVPGLRVCIWNDFDITGHASIDGSTPPRRGQIPASSTSIEFKVGITSAYRLTLVDLSGRELRHYESDRAQPGWYQIRVDCDSTVRGALRVRLELTDSAGVEPPFIDSNYAVAYAFRPIPHEVGRTSNTGQFTTTDSTLFPVLYHLGQIAWTTTSSPTPVGEFEFTNRTIVDVINPWTGEWMTDTTLLDPRKQNGIHFVWRPHPPVGDLVDPQQNPETSRTTGASAQSQLEAASAIRGDITCNGLANEIADAVMFENYFIKGQSAFGDSVCSREGADVNADGVALEVADLVQLIRVIVGDAVPYPSGYHNSRSPIGMKLGNDNGVISSEEILGGLFIVVQGNITPTLYSTNADMSYGFDGVNTRILISPPLTERGFAGFGQGQIIQVGVPDSYIVSMVGSTLDARPVTLDWHPIIYELYQNYPNPFN